MKSAWESWYGQIDGDQIDEFLKTTESQEWLNSGTGWGGETPNPEVHRRSQVKWLNPAQHTWARDIIWHFASQANKLSFGFDIALIDDIQLTKYEECDNGEYKWHHDVFWGNPTLYDRKLSVVIQLSDSDDYEGGDFKIDKGFPQPDPELLRKKGTVIVFPSFMTHCVEPVTKGTRLSLVSWIEGPKFR